MAFEEDTRRSRKARSGFRSAEDLEDRYAPGRETGGRYREESWEDEEDYEEYARARDREYARRTGQDAARVRGGRSASAARRASGSAGKQAQQGRGQRSRQPSDPADRPGTDRSMERKERRTPSKPRKKRRGFFGILLRLLVIVLLIAAIAGGFLAYRMRDVLEMQRVNSVDLEEELRPGISQQVLHDTWMEGYTNIALFGVDSRTGDLLDGDNRSDTIMIASINDKTGKIKLVSVYRDTILNVGGDYYTKANTAYSLGGPAQAINMLNRSLDLNIVDFMTVGFEGLAHTIDALGGIEIEIDEEERGYLNMYLHDMHLELGTDETPVEDTGLVSLTGIQATAYARIRYTAGDDFRRAERQRTVLQKTLEKARQASPTTLVDVANNVVGDMATSLSSREIVGLILKAGSLELEETGGIPQEDLRGFGENPEDGSYVLPMTLRDNVCWLHAFLFGEEKYTVSPEAEEVSDYIEANFPVYSY